MRIHICASYIIVPLLLGVTPTLAQQTAPSTGATRDIDEGALWEDMEVLSSLLQTTIREVYGGRPRHYEVVTSDAGVIGHIVGGSVFEPQKGQPGLLRLKRPHAAFLPGYGIVLQLDLPPLSPAAEGSETDDPTICPFTSKTPWERERLRLRGAWTKQDCQKCHENSLQHLVPAQTGLGQQYSTWVYHRSTADRGKRSATREQLVDRLIKLLAENGHQVRELEPEETIAIAMTFRDQARSRNPFGYGLGAAQQYSQAVADYTANLVGAPAQSSFADPYAQIPPAGQAKQQLATGRGRKDKPSESQRFIVSNWPVPFKSSPDEDEGDLYLRQNKHQQAVEAYEKALAALDRAFQQTAKRSSTGSTSAGPVLSGVDEQSRSHHARRLFRKLSQAHIAGGAVKEARAALDRLEQLEHDPKNSDSASEDRAPAGLPARLVIRVTKSVLDDFAAKKLSLEQFEDAVQVDFFAPKVVVDQEKPTTGNAPPSRR